MERMDINEGKLYVSDSFSAAWLLRHPTAKRAGTRIITTSEPTQVVDFTPLLSGLLAGVAQAGVFNPYDRALYLSVKDHRPFLSWKNWTNPYAGFFQSIGGKALSGSLYFPLEHLFLDLLRLNQQQRGGANPTNRDGEWKFLAGMAAGSVNASILNPLSAVRYKTWSRNVTTDMMSEIASMWYKSGNSYRPFLNGILPTVCRDMVFGAFYTGMRFQLATHFELPEEQLFLANILAAALATVASAPFNYARVRQYSTSSSVKADSVLKVWQELAQEIRCEPGGPTSKVSFLQRRLRIGWGTARVAMGMAFGHAVYDCLRCHLKPEQG